VLHVRGNVYMFASDDSNVTVQIGSQPGNDGIVLVDSGPPRLTNRILAELRTLTRMSIRFVINTSDDPDHVGGNAMRQPGEAAFLNFISGGIWAHDNVLKRMSAKGSGVPQEAWPTITYEQLKDFTFNGEAIQIFPEPSAHTDGDSIVFFRGSNVISAGDIFTTTGYPVIDLKRGGSIEGEIKALNHLLDLTVPDLVQEGGTMVIPGHGRLCDEADVTDYRDMVTILRDRIADLMAKGKTLDEIRAAKPTLDYDGRYSRPEWTGDMFVDAVYASLKQNGRGAQR
jgi:cyclase